MKTIIHFVDHDRKILSRQDIVDLKKESLQEYVLRNMKYYPTAEFVKIARRDNFMSINSILKSK